AGPHDQPLHRGEPHGGVDRHAAADRRGAAPVAEMDGDQVQVAERPAQQLGRPLADVAVAGAVEAVPAYAVPGVPVLGYRVTEGPGRHRVVERGIERGGLWQAGPGDTDRLDAGQGLRVVQRGQ